ncbi:hypothetical protein [Streptomyces synnematoformans]|uniref:Phage tail protein n=1 Tax=Streptomyces synnematoformans TaxID=415721 RepID=A0ABN2XXN3_9ACTN
MAASLHRRGVFELSLDGTTYTAYSCAPTAVVLTPEAGDTPDPVEPLCGDLLTGEPGPTSWNMNLTSLMNWESTDSATSSLVLWALENDGATAYYRWQPGPTSKIFSGQVRVVAIPIGGDVGGEYPTQEVEWPMVAKPVTTDPPTPFTVTAEASAPGPDKAPQDG